MRVREMFRKGELPCAAAFSLALVGRGFVEEKQEVAVLPRTQWQAGFEEKYIVGSER